MTEVSYAKADSNQFEIMIDFMEKHGDLSKPPDGVKSRELTTRQWIMLTDLLNSQNQAAQKPTSKWRKAWSDLKNNTKRKAMRMSDVGAYPKTKFSRIEKRVIRFLCSQPARPKMPYTRITKRSPSTDTSEEESTNIEDSINPLDTSTNKLEESVSQLDNSTTSTDATQTFEKVIIKKLNDCEKERIRLETERLRLESERLRLKEIELRQQAQWQDLLRQFMTMINKYLDKNVYA